MNNLSHYIKKATKLPPHILFKKVFNRVNLKLRDKIQRAQDLKKRTNINFNVPIIKNSYLNITHLDISGIDKKVAIYLQKMYCDHRFDLLGSGWVKNTYNSIPLGVEGYTFDMNVSVENSKYKAENYEPIDWQKDFKSGFRWNEKKWYKEQRIGHKIGADIKVPWELARMQHLPQLAIFSLVDESLKEQNLREFKNQILDFIANNPPRMGVNWVCTMDVGIRAANMLVAYDIFCQIDNIGLLDDNFKQKFANSIYEHGLHIINNLEYGDLLTSNHYLSDIAGLLFISAYLENFGGTDVWLAFSLQEIINEMKKEFYEDGGNFESSTSYHRLSGELMVYSTALVLGLKPEKIEALSNYKNNRWKFEPKLKPLEKQEYKINDSRNKIILPQWFIDRLYKIGRYTVDITKPDSEIPQFGDNDSGRFFKFTPVGSFISNQEAENKYLNLKGYLDNLSKNNIIEDTNDPFWDENILNHSTFTSCFAYLFNDIFKNTCPLEASIVKNLANNAVLLPKDITYSQLKINKISINDEELKYTNTIKYDFETKLENIKFVIYPDSGIYIFKNEKFYLAVCATPLGQNNFGGHTHNDKLGYELWYNGQNIARDPGTYLYTPIPERRNEFRSTKAHNVPIVEGIEQNQWIEGYQGLFGLSNDTKVFICEIKKNYLKAYLYYKDIKIIREFIISENYLLIQDRSNKEFFYSEFKYYSNGYGKLSYYE